MTHPVFDLSPAVAQAAALNRWCRFKLLCEQLRSYPSLTWLVAVPPEDVLMRSTPFFWRAVDRCHITDRLPFDAQHRTLWNLAVAAFDSFFPILPDGTACVLSASTEPTIVLPQLGVEIPVPPIPLTLRRVTATAIALADGRVIPLDPPPANPVRFRVGNFQVWVLARGYSGLVDDALIPDLLTGAAVGEMSDRICIALDLICRADPDLGAAVASRVGWYIPISIKDSKLHESFSIRNLPGVIFLSDSPAPLVLAEAIIHEYHHQLLFLQSAAHDLLIGGDEAAYYSPWRDDARPLEMLLHALYVFTGVVGFLRRIEDIPGIDMGVARGRREYIAHQLQLGFLQLPMDRLTDAGRALVAVVQAAANRHTADLNLKSSKRPARVIDHLERWRAAHPHLRPTEVGQGGIPS